MALLLYNFGGSVLNRLEKQTGVTSPPNFSHRAYGPNDHTHALLQESKNLVVKNIIQLETNLSMKNIVKTNYVNTVLNAINTKFYYLPHVPLRSIQVCDIGMIAGPSTAGRYGDLPTLSGGRFHWQKFCQEFLRGHGAAEKIPLK